MSRAELHGDGLGDVLIGAYQNDSNTQVDAGRSYVVFGVTTNTPINLADVVSGVGGFAIDAQNSGDWAGRSVSGLGDINGDGLADILIGANNAASGSGNGRAYVVYGKTGGGPVNLANVVSGTGGFAILAQGSGDNAGRSVSAAPSDYPSTLRVDRVGRVARVDSIGAMA